MKISKLILLITIASIFLFSCAKEIELLEKGYGNVDQELWSFYEEFEFQARNRGINIDLSDLEVSAEVKEINEDGVAGTCQYGSHISNHITIDKSFWNRATNLSKEMVVFHELGHCVLLRAHDESRNNAGLCLSIMRSGVGQCRDAYNTTNRKVYLDELFSKSNEL